MANMNELDRRVTELSKARGLSYREAYAALLREPAAVPPKAAPAPAKAAAGPVTLADRLAALFASLPPIKPNDLTITSWGTNSCGLDGYNNVTDPLEEVWSLSRKTVAQAHVDDWRDHWGSGRAQEATIAAARAVAAARSAAPKATPKADPASGKLRPGSAKPRPSGKPISLSALVQAVQCLLDDRGTKNENADNAFHMIAELYRQERSLWSYPKDDKLWYHGLLGAYAGAREANYSPESVATMRLEAEWLINGAKALGAR